MLRRSRPVAWTRHLKNWDRERAGRNVLKRCSDRRHHAGHKHMCMSMPQTQPYTPRHTYLGILSSKSIFNRVSSGRRCSMPRQPPTTMVTMTTSQRRHRDHNDDRKVSFNTNYEQGTMKFLMRWQKCKIYARSGWRNNSSFLIYLSPISLRVCCSSHYVARSIRVQTTNGKRQTQSAKKMGGKNKKKSQILQIHTQCVDERRDRWPAKWYDSSWISTLPEWHKFCLV